MRVDSHLRGWRCARGHVYLHRHEQCPECGHALAPTRLRARARLLSHTTVRVNPAGVPFRLGVARAAAGATTLCVIEGRVRGHGSDAVTLVWRDGHFVALGARARLEARD